MAIARPSTEEYAPFFAGYIDAVKEDDVLALLQLQVAERQDLLGGLDDARGHHAYEEGKWSIQEIIGHLIDTERLFTFRALWAVRGDPSPLPGMDQDVWMAQAHFETRSLSDMLAELDVLRSASLAFYANLDESVLQRRVEVEGHLMSARATAFMIAGHERHHMGVLRERYL